LHPEQKISPAFEPYLADSRRRDKLEAVVIYQSPTARPPRGRESLRLAETRVAYVAEQAALHKEVEGRILRDYADTGDEPLMMSPIGSSALPAITVEVTQRTLLALAQQPDVLAIMPNQRIHLIKPTAITYDELARNEMRHGHTWGLEHLSVGAVWEKSRGTGVNVAVLDTGVFGDHPALQGRIADFVVIDPLGRRITTTPMFDAGSHGTHVCGTIAGGQTPEGVNIGVAPDAKLLVAGVLVGDATVRTLLEGLDWAIEKGADIVNMSLGFSYYEPMFTQIFDVTLGQYGVLPVIAVGNEAQGNSSSPGNAYNALGVGALEKVGRGRAEVAFFSSGASLVFPGQEPNALVNKPDVVAPGVQVLSTIPPVLRPGGAYFYSYMDGTSMATPHVAGVAALLMAAYPDAPAVEIMRVIKETAQHPDGAERRPDNRWGYGMVRPMEALAALAA
jgi:subtilisin family serine protease